MNAKIYNGNVQPNPKEFKIWVNDEGTIKTWNGTEWVEQSDSSDGSGNGSGSGLGVEYTYLDLRGVDIGSNQAFLNIINLASFMSYKVSNQGQDVHCILSLGLFANADVDVSNVVGLAIDETFMITHLGASDLEQKYSVKEVIELLAINDLYIPLPRITKEQFYNL